MIVVAVHVLDELTHNLTACARDFSKAFRCIAAESFERSREAICAGVDAFRDGQINTPIVE